MCGIFGFLTTSPGPDKFKTLVRLAHASKDRGTDATGVAYWDGEEKAFVIDKHHVDSQVFFQTILKHRKDVISKTHICIGHVRRWTTGKPSVNRNNHPIFSKNYVLVHNGTCLQTPRIDKYEYIGEVDSELILAQIEDKGIKGGLEHCQGTAALAFIDKRKKSELLFYRDGNPIVLAYDDRDPTVYFASTEEILLEALGERMLLGFFPKHIIRELPRKELWRVASTKADNLNLKMVEEIEYTKFRHWNTELWNQSFYGTTHKSATDYNKKNARNTDKAHTNLVERYEWNRYYHVVEDKIVQVQQFAWQWLPEENCWIHKKEKLVKFYNPNKHRIELAPPDVACDLKWISKDPYATEESDGKGKEDGTKD